MAIERVITEINAADAASINFLKALVVADGGTWRIVPEADGTVSLYATFPKAVSPDLATPSPSDPAFAWMTIARGELGQKEAAGGDDNPRIREYHATTKGGAEPDSVPWCSSFVNFCITKAGLTGANSKASRSWLGWGRKIDTPVAGCVVVLSRGADPAKGHVGFYVGEEGGMVRLLGGNQGDAVTIASHAKSRLLGFRMP
jgi:uncharacterized protein (TIGR02594 family)